MKPFIVTQAPSKKSFKNVEYDVDEAINDGFVQNILENFDE